MILHRFQRALMLGLRSLALHKLRSTLTALGIIFGVSSVIAMLSIGEGANWEAQEEIKKLGSQNIILKSIKPMEEEQGGVTRSEVIEYGLTMEDFDRITDTIPGVMRPLVPMRIARADGNEGIFRIDVQIVGTTPEFLKVANAHLERGRFIVPNDMSTLLNTCAIGAQVERTLFPAVDPLGKVLRLGRDYYQIVGIMEETGAATGVGSIEADDRNKNVYIPATTFDRRMGQTLVRVVSGERHMERVELHQIIVSLKSDDMVAPAAEAIRGLLEKAHKGKKDYEVVVPLELLQQKERTKRIFNIVLGSIAAISLLVGGIGIMNIMLATITERTREIGIRRALGAKQRDITTQFLIETVVLSTSGGLLGILLGIAIPFAVEAST